MLHMMTHYVFRNSDGRVHVQNMVGGHSGQHHIHTAEEYRAWAAEIPGRQLKEMNQECDCGRHDGTYAHWPKREKGDGDEQGCE